MTPDFMTERLVGGRNVCTPQMTLVGESRRRRFLAASLGLLFSCLPACRVPLASSHSPVILLFNGNGTSPNDVVALKSILDQHHFRYATADSRQLNSMNASQLKAYQLFIVPGGNFAQIGHGLTADTTTKVRDGVRNGLNYLGMCAGAFFAGNSPYNGLNLTSGVQFNFYALAYSGVRKAAVEISIAASPALVHYWEDGPQLMGWGEVVARYPDGTPAIVQGNFGDGWVMLSGIHPEAPESWRRGMAFTTPTSVAHAYAAQLISAALHRTRLSHY